MARIWQWREKGGLNIWSDGKLSNHGRIIWHWLNCSLAVYCMRKKQKNWKLSKHIMSHHHNLPSGFAFQNRHKLFIPHLELSLVEGTNWHLVTRVAQVHKHHYPGLLFRSWQVLLVDSISQSDWSKQWLGLACAHRFISIKLTTKYFIILISHKKLSFYYEVLELSKSLIVHYKYNESQAACPEGSGPCSKVPAVVSFISRRQLRPAIWAASMTDLLSASVK